MNTAAPYHAIESLNTADVHLSNTILTYLVLIDKNKKCSKILFTIHLKYVLVDFMIKTLKVGAYRPNTECLFICKLVTIENLPLQVCIIVFAWCIYLLGGEIV